MAEVIKGQTSSNSTIVKNTIYLYVRMLFLIGINLFAARIILQALGASDYGLYNVVGGIVVIFSIINSILSSGTSRFLTFELGTGDFDNLKKTFSASFALHCFVAIIVVFFSETVGLWFLNTKLQIPADRLSAANWVYQFSVLSSILSLTQVPYSASIISHEKMNVYAWVGLAEGIFKLVLALALLYVDLTDKLISYAAMCLTWSCFAQLFYRYYCVKHFPETKLTIVRERKVYDKMLKFSLWDSFGAIGFQGNSQGINFLLNIFFGLNANAARGIAVQVDTQSQMFYQNFTTAVTPQIVKSFAAKDYKRFFDLVFESSKYSYFLYFIVALPLFLECDYVLSLWLVEVPELASVFIRSILVMQLGRAMARPVINACHATGSVKRLNLYTSFVVLLTLPLTYFAFKIGCPPVTAFIINGALLYVASFVELYVLKLEIYFNYWEYVRDVFIRCFLSSIIMAIPAVLINVFIEESFVRLVLTIIVSLGSVSLGVYYYILTNSQRVRIIAKIKNKLINANNNIE